MKKIFEIINSVIFKENKEIMNELHEIAK